MWEGVVANRVCLTTVLKHAYAHRCNGNKVDDMADFAAFTARKHKRLDGLPWFAAGYSIGGTVRMDVKSGVGVVGGWL